MSYPNKPNMENYKIVMLGSGAVGKSSITVQLVNNHFTEYYDPTIEDSYRTVIDVDGKNVALSILDTAGQEEFFSIRDQSIKSGEAYVLVFSIISKSSFGDVVEAKEQVYRVNDKDDDEHIPFILVGNKCDLADQREVDKEEAENLAKEWGVEYIEVSAKEKININEIFKKLVYDIRKHNKSINPENDETNINQKTQDSNQNSYCSCVFL